MGQTIIYGTRRRKTAKDQNANTPPAPSHKLAQKRNEMRGKMRWAATILMLLLLLLLHLITWHLVQLPQWKWGKCVCKQTSIFFRSFSLFSILGVCFGRWFLTPTDSFPLQIPTESLSFTFSSSFFRIVIFSYDVTFVVGKYLVTWLLAKDIRKQNIFFRPLGNVQLEQGKMENNAGTQ